MAGTTRDKRNADLVRTYLKALPDSRGNSKTGDSIETVSDELQVPVGDLRGFRDAKDGDNSALSTALVTTMAKLIGSDSVVSGFNYDDSLDRNNPLRLVSNLLYQDTTRIDRYRHYDTIDKTRPEAHSALDAWADLGVTGGVGGDCSRAFVPEYQGKDEGAKRTLADIATNINTYVFPHHAKLSAFRGMSKFGDQWGELGLGDIDGRTDLVELESRHAMTMYVKRDERGRPDPKEPYQQILPGANEPIATWAPWQIARFSNTVEWGEIYGESIFQPCLRSWVQLEAMEAAMIVRRLTRAPLRLHHILDVGHLAADKIEDAIEAQRKNRKKKTTVDANGRLNRFGINMPTEEDLFSGKRDKDSPADVKVLEGDAHIGEITDFIHFFNKWLAGLGPPKAHLGYETDTMRSVITDLHIVFARKARRAAMRFIAGLNHLYWVSLILRGIDPRTVPYLLLPPSMGTRDELVHAQVMQTYATTVKYLSDAFGVTGQVPSIQWFLRNILGLSVDAIDALDLKDAINLKGRKSQKNDPASGLASNEMAQAALTSDEVAKQVAATTFVLGERAFDKRAEGVLGLRLHPYSQLEFAPVGPAMFESFAMKLGRRVSELRRVG
jgi:hypothetical protein